MNALNQIIVEGNVVKDPESHTFPSGTHSCSFPIAVNRFYKASSGEKAQEVSFFDVETFGSLADACVKWCPKGRGVRIVGRLKQDRWKTEEGKQKSRIHIIAEHVEFKPVFKKAGESADSVEADAAPTSADASGSPSKRKKLAMLAEAAAAAQREQEAGDITV